MKLMTSIILKPFNAKDSYNAKELYSMKEIAHK